MTRYSKIAESMQRRRIDPLERAIQKTYSWLDALWKPDPHGNNRREHPAHKQRRQRDAFIIQERRAIMSTSTIPIHEADRVWHTRRVHHKARTLLIRGREIYIWKGFEH